jgi:hypothetical protein
VASHLILLGFVLLQKAAQNSGSCPIIYDLMIENDWGKGLEPFFSLDHPLLLRKAVTKKKKTVWSKPLGLNL